MPSNYPDGINAADIDALFLPADQEARVEAAEARFAKVQAAVAALDATLKAMEAEGDVCPFPGFDFDDIPTAVELYTADAFALAMEKHVQEAA